MLRTIEFEDKEALVNTGVFSNLVECGYVSRSFIEDF